MEEWPERHADCEIGQELQRGIEGAARFGIYEMPEPGQGCEGKEAGRPGQGQQDPGRDLDEEQGIEEPERRDRRIGDAQEIRQTDRMVHAALPEILDPDEGCAPDHVRQDNGPTEPQQEIRPGLHLP